MCMAMTQPVQFNNAGVVEDLLRWEGDGVTVLKSDSTAAEPPAVCPTWL
jgi:hypothetical protein